MRSVPVPLQRTVHHARRLLVAVALILLGDPCAMAQTQPTSRPAGGVSVEAAGATDGVDAVLEAYAGQPVVCLAGTDAAYAEWGADLVAALRAAGASYVVLAGKPGEKTVSDVDDSCAMGVDALGFLGRIREELAR